MAHPCTRTTRWYIRSDTRSPAWLFHLELDLRWVPRGAADGGGTQDGAAETITSTSTETITTSITTIGRPEIAEPARETPGSTTRHIGEAPHTATERQRTNMVVRREEIHFPIVNRQL